MDGSTQTTRSNESMKCCCHSRNVCGTTVDGKTGCEKRLSPSFKSLVMMVRLLAVPEGAVVFVARQAPRPSSESPKRDRVKPRAITRDEKERKILKLVHRLELKYRAHEDNFDFVKMSGQTTSPAKEAIVLRHAGNVDPLEQIDIDERVHCKKCPEETLYWNGLCTCGGCVQVANEIQWKLVEQDAQKDMNKLFLLKEIYWNGNFVPWYSKLPTGRMVIFAKPREKKHAKRTSIFRRLLCAIGTCVLKGVRVEVWSVWEVQAFRELGDWLKHDKYRHEMDIQ